MKTIPVRNRFDPDCFAMVDDEDYEMLSKHGWGITGRLYKGNKWLYAATVIRVDLRVYKSVSMHRMIMNAQKGQIVDHIDGNRFNNQKDNLRFCTHTENMRNRAKHRTKNKYKGVYKNSRGKKFKAMIFEDGKLRVLGSFESEIEAAFVYDKAAMDIHGDFANTNFPVMSHG